MENIIVERVGVKENIPTPKSEDKHYKSPS